MYLALRFSFHFDSIVNYGYHPRGAGLRQAMSEYENLYYKCVLPLLGYSCLW